jgi:hypothetical protein
MSANLAEGGLCGFQDWWYSQIFSSIFGCVTPTLLAGPLIESSVMGFHDKVDVDAEADTLVLNVKAKYLF